MSDLFDADYDNYLSMSGDRDDRDDLPAAGDDRDYCEHGKYVGGCGIDWMCEWCEAGIPLAEAKRIVTAEKTRATRERASRAAQLLYVLLAHGMGGIDAAHFAQESSYTVNPRARYGRH